MLIRFKLFSCALSLCTLGSVYGEDFSTNEIKDYSRNGRRKRISRSFATRIGSRSPPYFENRKPNLIEQTVNLAQTVDIAESVRKPQNRDLADGFDESAFWQSYLLSGQVNSMPIKPTHAPISTYAPISTNAPIST